MTLIAYHGLEANKTTILAQIATHREADEIIKGRYWEDGKGCAVGCTVHSGQHAEYERLFGIPQILARLEDTIFEGLPNDLAQLWPERFMASIRPGADLSRVGWQFLHWLLTDSAVNPGINHPIVCDAIKQCADVLLPLTRGEPFDQSAVSAARSAAGSAAWSAASAGSAAGGAGSAAGSAASAAGSAVWSAVSAAWSAERAAWSAASAAGGAGSAAGSAASAAYERMAEKLIALIEAV